MKKARLSYLGRVSQEMTDRRKSNWQNSDVDDSVQNTPQKPKNSSRKQIYQNLHTEQSGPSL